MVFPDLTVLRTGANVPSMRRGRKMGAIRTIAKFRQFAPQGLGLQGVEWAPLRNRPSSRAYRP